MAVDVTLQSPGEGIESSDVLEILVKEGDPIRNGQDLVRLETDKATFEIQSPTAGTVLKVHVQPGETVAVGGLLVSLEASAGEAAAATTTPETPAAAETPPPAVEAPPAASEAPPAASEAPPAASEAPPAAPESPAAAAAPGPAESPVTAAPAARGGEGETGRGGQAESGSPAPAPKPAASPAAAPHSAQELPAVDASVPAGPAVRRFAREVGVDLNRVRGTGPGGRITREDVLGVVRSASHKSSGPGTVVEPNSQDAYGPVRVEPLPKIRRTIAAKMHESWSTVPRVTNFDDADVSELERMRQSSKRDYAAKGVKLTSMPFIMKAVAMSLRDHPTINATVDLEKGQVVYKDYIHIGVAVDTERGLVVPVLRDADEKSISEIARELATMAEQVRDGSFTIDQTRGSTFTISNLGAIGGTYSTPIVNVPEVAILLIGRSRKMPIVVEDQIAIRLMMPLSMSYDHRLVDGGAAARFLNEVIGYLEAPSRLLLAP